jgi:hypothetical protein
MKPTPGFQVEADFCPGDFEWKPVRAYHPDKALLRRARAVDRVLQEAREALREAGIRDLDM